METIKRRIINSYSQYKNDFFNKLNFNFQKGKKILDVGCGPGTDAGIFIKTYKLKVYGIDIYKDEHLKKLPLQFKIGSIFKIPFKDNEFDYVFVHDVVHHIDEKRHRRRKHADALEELRRVCKKKGTVIIVEGNRYNPLFYLHMVKMRKHEHLRQSYFKELIKDMFKKDDIDFRFFEAHLYPKKLLFIFKFYEYIMEHFMPRQILAYNSAIIRKT